MNITIYTLAFNESFMLPLFIFYYRQVWPACKIVVYNNMSSDNTKQIAEEAGCEVRDYDTGGKLSDETYLKIKSNCWKDADTDWVAIVDVDEWIAIAPDIIEGLEDLNPGLSIIRFAGFNMCNLNDNMNVLSIQHGIRSTSYDKLYCFNKSKVKEINYGLGCHNANPVGDIVYSNETLPAFHYKYINIDYMIRRHALFASRLSPDNLKRGLGSHYRYPAKKIRAEFAEARNRAIKIL